MIDRPSRDKVIELFEAYLDDRITAFEFDEKLSDIDSQDRTVNELISVAWFYYDDCTDHKVHLSKVDWDFFQRLLLLLRSDAEVSFTIVRRWGWDHAVAWLALSLFVAEIFLVGWSWHLPLVAGNLSVAISLYRRRKEPAPSPGEMARMPFESLAQMLRLLRRVPEFKKRKYRPEIGDRKIRSEAAEGFLSIGGYLAWLALAPFVLLAQGFPSPEHTLPKITTA